MMHTKQPDPRNAARTKVIACATVIEEMQPHLPSGMEVQVLNFGLHVNPQELKRILREAIEATVPQIDTVILGYGFCPMVMVGWQATHRTMVVPKTDDYIAIFLWS